MFMYRECLKSIVHNYYFMARYGVLPWIDNIRFDCEHCALSLYFIAGFREIDEDYNIFTLILFIAKISLSLMC